MQQTKGQETSLNHEQSPPNENNDDKQQNQFVNIDQIKADSSHKKQPKTVDHKQQQIVVSLNNEVQLLTQIKLSKSILYDAPVYFKPHEIKLKHNTSHRSKAKITNAKQKITLDPQWIQHLRQAYNYYCKSTYATGRNPTFDRIKEETNAMHSSTFVAFCRDFGIQIQLDKLMSIFKQVSNYKTTLTFQNFVEATLKICNQLFPQSEQSKNEFLVGNKATRTKYFQSKTSKNIQQILAKTPSNMIEAIKLMGLNSAATFHNKMVKISQRSRSHGLNAHQNLIKLKPLSQYKFKVSALNGKNTEQVEEELMYRRQIKQQNKSQQKHLKQSEKEKAAKRFKYLNKISMSEKKVTKGGYMSPPMLKNAEESCGPEQSRVYNKHMHASKQTKNNYRLVLVNEEDIEYENGRRIHTELNTYNNSLQNSMYMKQHHNSKVGKREKSQQSQIGYENEVTSYLQSYRQKRTPHQGKYQYQARKFQLNQVVMQAKTEAEHGKKIVQSPQTNNTRLAFPSNMSSIYNPPPAKRAKQTKVKTENAVIQQPSSLGSIIDFMDDTEDQYLKKLANLKNREASKKRIVLNF